MQTNGSEPKLGGCFKQILEQLPSSIFGFVIVLKILWYMNYTLSNMKIREFQNMTTQTNPLYLVHNVLLTNVSNDIIYNHDDHSYIFLIYI